MKKTLLITVLPVLLVAATATAGTISPALQGILDYSGPDEPVSVIVHMTDQAPIGELSASLSLSRTSRQERHSQIVVALQEAAASQNDLIAELDAGKSGGGVIGFTSYWIANLMVVQAVPDEIVRIADRSDVAWLEPNFVPELIAPIVGSGDEPIDDMQMGALSIGLAPGIAAVRANEVWEQLGFTGAGRIVASCDTGVDGNHPAHADRWRGNEHPWQECWLDVLGGTTTFPNDSNGHGTHTTGTMTGLAPDDSIGVAPDADWIATNVINQGVSPGFDNDVLLCYQWFADPDGDPVTVDDVPDVVCNSWGINEGGPGGYTDCDSRWWAVIDNCEAAGVVTVWAAGNEGPGSTTLRSPADRASSETSSFAVGAVNATNYEWPYPIWAGSSRGPSGCSAPPELLIKPEVAAPGVNVYSAVPGGGYQSWTGTSMATPHVAGVVALMREANPDLEVEQIKLILMQAARDEGNPGDDNSYGHGFIDAVAAVEMSMGNYSLIEGHVTNASFGDLPIEGAEIFLVEHDRGYVTDEDGYYSARVPFGLYTAVVSASGFASFETTIDVPEGGDVVENFALVDNLGPWIDNVAQPISSPETGPYPITAEVDDPSTVAQVVLYSRTTGNWQQTVMTPQDGGFSGGLPGEPANTQIDYYVEATDGVGHTSVAPEGAPSTTYTLYVTEQVYAYDAEDPDDPAWQLGIPADDATGGIWVRVDPNGTTTGGEQLQPEDDHTPDPGVKCFVTGNGEPGDSGIVADVDGGCTTLLSPTFDLAGADMAFVNYWRWFGEFGYWRDDQLEISVSADGGLSWTPIDIVEDNANYWEHVVVELSSYLPLTDQMVFRVLACDLEGGTLLEAAIDDFGVESYNGSGSTAVGNEDTPAGDVFRLAQNHPNPFNPVTTISFSLARASDVELSIYSLDGRKVATLVRESMPVGSHDVIWNGQDSRGQQVASGTYLYRLQAGSEIATRRMVLLK